MTPEDTILGNIIQNLIIGVAGGLSVLAGYTTAKSLGQEDNSLIVILITLVIIAMISFFAYILVKIGTPKKKTDSK
jgi:membrane-anchored glycerophosphoryl diester phosphodiesterase (GDPDase)